MKDEDIKQYSTFHKLFKVDVSKHVKKKGKYSYLSWAYAVQELKRVVPDARWGVTKSEDGSPFFKTECGYFVEVWVDVKGISLSQVHPVLDNRNEPIEKPNAFQINTSLQRALAKAIALHGLGLYIFAGEDLPDSITEKQEKEITKLANQVKDEQAKQTMLKAIESGKVNESNYEKSLEHCKTIIKNQKGEK